MSKDQINLPKTVFSMKANLPAKEPNLVKYWDEIKLYETLRKKAKGKEKFILKPKRMAKGHVIAHADGIDNRDAAERLRGTELFITREALPPPGEEEFYHNDLIDVAVFAVNGHVLGSVIAVHDFGAGTILEVARKVGKTVLVPFTKDVVPVVDLAAKRIEINPPEGLFGPIAQQTAGEGCGLNGLRE